MKKFKKIIVIIPIIVILFSLICIPVSALYFTDYGFDVVSSELAWSSSVSGTPSGVYVYEDLGGQNSAIFTGITGNAQATGYYRPYKLVLKAGTTNSSYTVKVRYTAFIFSKQNSVGYASLKGTCLAYVNGLVVSSKKITADSVGDAVPQGAEFTFQIKSGETKTLLMYAGTNSYLADQYYYSVYFYITPNSDTQQIVDNQNQNAESIKQNQDKNTSEITNGYENDTDTTLEGSDDYKDLEEEAIGSTNEQAKSEASNVTDGANSGFLKYMSAFTSVANMFADFFQITVPDFGILVMISLAIGILPLLVGLTVNDAKARDRFNAREARSARKIEMHNAKVRSRKGG